jgi:hypothetical protein
MMAILRSRDPLIKGRGDHLVARTTRVAVVAIALIVVSLIHFACSEQHARDVSSDQREPRAADASGSRATAMSASVAHAANYN